MPGTTSWTYIKILLQVLQLKGFVIIRDAELPTVGDKVFFHLGMTITQVVLAHFELVHQKISKEDPHQVTAEDV